MGRKKWADIKTAAMSAEEIAAAKAETDEMLRDLSLAQVRKAIGMAQATVAELLRVTQGEVSRMERRPDLYISTLRRYLQAMNGELVLVARFPGQPDRTIRLEELEATHWVRQYGRYFAMLYDGPPSWRLTVKGPTGYVLGNDLVPPAVLGDDLEEAQRQVDEILAGGLHAAADSEWTAR